MLCLLILLACGLTLALEDEQVYCGARYTHLCLGKGHHVACQFPVAGSGPNCQNYSKIRFTSELRNVITHFINKRRQRIAAGHERVRGGKHIPMPQVMMFVEWDFELARLAQRLADQCYFVHDECRATVRYPYSGQAVGEVRWRHLSDNYELSAQRGIRRVFDAWWGERRRVEPHQLVQPFRIKDNGVVRRHLSDNYEVTAQRVRRPVFDTYWAERRVRYQFSQPFKIKGKGLAWGHFSQLAVWTLRAVGCGAVRHGEDYPRLLLVCDFSHTNMLGERTLIPGETAPCPEHTRRKVRTNFPLLCATVKEQIKHSRVVEEDVLEDSDYEEEEGNTEMMLRQELRRLGVVATRKPNRGDEWKNRLKPTEESDVEETSTVKRWTTGTYIDEHELNSEEDPDYVATSTPEATKAPRKKLRINFKLGPNTTPKQNGRKVLVRGEDNKFLTEKTPRVQSNDEHDNDVQETLILTQTSSPFFLDNKLRSQKQERLKNRIDSTTISAKVIHNANLQYNPRHRWKPERDRPSRPGAAALLRSNPPQPPAEKQEPAIPPRISFKMDDDDVEQLHADTGFKPSWMKNETQKVA